jgi:predicted RNase H-like nuclease
MAAEAECVIDGGARVPDSGRVTGIDACRGGWVAVTLRDGLLESVRTERTLAAVIEGAPGVLGIDMPLGFADGRWRPCDRLARTLLGPRRASVFSIPPLPVWECATYREANQRCRDITGNGLSAQAWGLRAKLLEANRCRMPGRQMFEVHPELSFASLAGGPLPLSKHCASGLALRREVLTRAGIVLPGDAVGADVLDAAAAAWSAWRIARGEARVLPDPPDTGADGLELAIRY